MELSNLNNRFNIVVHDHSYASNELFFEQPANFSGNSEIDEHQGQQNDKENEKPEPAKRGKGKTYEEWHNFRSIAEFNEFWNVEKPNWRWKNDGGKKEDVEFWNCRYSKRSTKDVNCDVKVKVLFSQQNESVILYKSIDQHQHEDVFESKRIKANVKERILELANQGLNASKVLNVIRKEKVEPLPALTQVQSTNKYARKKQNGGSNPFTVDQLREYSEQHTDSPQDPNQPFVVYYHVDGPKQFVVLWSTVKLLAKQKTSRQIQIDSTFSLTYNHQYWEDFPVQVLGHSDRDRHFHPCFLTFSSGENTWVHKKIFEYFCAISYSPDFVLADGATCITKACAEMFPETTKRLMCYAHVFRAVQRRTKQLSQQQQKTIFNDIHLLQVSKTDSEFKKVAPMMLNSWAESGYNELAEYFFNTWIQSGEWRWYEGANPMCSTNNGLEAINNWIKDTHTFHTLRRKLKFSEFVRVGQIGV